MATAHQLGMPVRSGRDHVRGSRSALATLLVYGDDECAREPASALYGARVREDYLSGLESGVTGKPTLFINNVRHVGAHDAGSLIEAIEHVRPLPAGALPGSGVRTPMIQWR
jgi:hypothetical protein